MFAGAFMYAMLSGKELHECGYLLTLPSKIVQTFGPRLKRGIPRSLRKFINLIIKSL